MMRVLLIAVLALVVFGCQQPQNQEPSEAETKEQPAERAIVINSNFDNEYEPDPFIIRNPWVEGDSLKLTVRYSGGCEVHTFGLIGTREWMESYPVQTRIVLTHDDNGETCKRDIVEEIAFDLSPLKEEYIKTYNSENDTIMLRLDRWQEPIAYGFSN